MIILLIIAFVCTGLYEVPALIRKKCRRELAAFSFFFILALVLCLLQTVGVEMASPMEFIKYLIKDVLHLGYKPG